MRIVNLFFWVKKQNKNLFVQMNGSTLNIVWNQAVKAVTEEKLWCFKFCYTIQS